MLLTTYIQILNQNLVLLLYSISFLNLVELEIDSFITGLNIICICEMNNYN